MVVTSGGLTWWRDFICVACYNLLDQRDEVRDYRLLQPLCTFSTDHFISHFLFEVNSTSLFEWSDQVMMIIVEDMFLIFLSFFGLLFNVFLPLSDF